MTTRHRKAAQKEFLHRCVTTGQPLEELIEDLNILPQTLLKWMEERDFKSRVHGMRRYLRKARELQIQASALRAASLITRIADGDNVASYSSERRAACIDVIRLARDSRARRRAQDADVLNKDRRLAHPDLSEEEADRLAQELSDSEKTPNPGANG
jgi:alkanesulfonate monooxygenase SsuD/methylene tetrahydromethanopterin reductase-like flavin-dependent oxidoreductase (luciferase family)